jgi:hypothetical protein
MTEAYDGQQVVGMDLHRHRGLLVRMTADGAKLETVRINNNAAELRRMMARAGVCPRGGAGPGAQDGDRGGPVRDHHRGLCAAERVRWPVGQRRWAGRGMFWGGPAACPAAGR